MPTLSPPVKFALAAVATLAAAPAVAQTLRAFKAAALAGRPTGGVPGGPLADRLGADLWALVSLVPEHLEVVAVSDEDARGASEEVAASLRARGISTEVAPSAAKFGKQIRHADRRGEPDLMPTRHTPRRGGQTPPACPQAGPTRPSAMQLTRRGRNQRGCPRLGPNSPPGPGPPTGGGWDPIH